MGRAWETRDREYSLLGLLGERSEWKGRDGGEGRDVGRDERG